MQSVSITTKILNLNSVHGEVYSIKHYVIKFLSDLRQVGAWFSPLNFLTTIKVVSKLFYSCMKLERREYFSKVFAVWIDNWM